MGAHWASGTTDGTLGQDTERRSSWQAQRPRDKWGWQGRTPFLGWTVVTQAACPGVSHLDAPSLAGASVTPVPTAAGTLSVPWTTNSRLSPTAHTQWVQGGV